MYCSANCAVSFFPAVFGKARNQPLNEATVHKKFKQEARKTGLSPTALAEGFLRVAVENMAGAIRRISVARGIDPRKRCAHRIRRCGRPARLCTGRRRLHSPYHHIPIRLRAVGLGYRHGRYRRY